MRKIMQEIHIYKFNELSDKAKEKVCNENYENYPMELITEDLLNYISENNNYYTDIKIQWSLSNCQGDGVSFKSTVDIKKFINVNFPTLSRFKTDLIIEHVKYFTTGNTTNHYAYANKNQVDYDYYYKSASKRFETLLLKILDRLKADYFYLCQKLEQIGYKELYYVSSNEYAQEMATANDYEYLYNGKIHNITTPYYYSTVERGSINDPDYN